MKTLISLLKDQSGAAAAEYALILAIIGSGLAVAALFLGKSIGNSLNTRGNQIANCTANAATC
jgi:pilus assembly protein Flp/PilA